MYFGDYGESVQGGIRGTAVASETFDGGGVARGKALPKLTTRGDEIDGAKDFDAQGRYRGLQSYSATATATSLCNATKPLSKLASFPS